MRWLQYSKPRYGKESLKRRRGRISNRRWREGHSGGFWLRRFAMKGLFCNCICAWQPVQVVHGDGHIRSLARPVTVGELLKCHPHHFVCEPTSTGPLYHSGMLPFDMVLEEGRIYLLLPLPRLLPHLASAYPNSQCCPCFNSHSDTLQDNEKPAPKAEENMENHRVRSWIGRHRGQFRKVRRRVAKSKLVRSLVRMSARIIPERVRFRFSFQKLNNDENDDASKGSSPGVAKSVQFGSCRNRWRPGLECISELDMLNGLLRVDSAVSLSRW